jgi:tryptophan halogenase
METEPCEAGAARAMLRSIEGLPLEGFERSFKVSPRKLLANRFLAGVNSRDLPAETLSGVCGSLRMPRWMLDQVRIRSAEATTVHFGFEQGTTSAIYKVYLEFARRLQLWQADPVLLHLAYKWDPIEPSRHAVASYVCVPGLDARQIAERVAAVTSGPARRACGEVLSQVSLRTADLMYLDVTEEGNPRRSFDLNVHEASLAVSDVAAPIAQACTAYGCPPARVQALIDFASSARLAHLAGGVSRDGEEFMTLYYAPGIT